MPCDAGKFVIGHLSLSYARASGEGVTVGDSASVTEILLDLIAIPSVSSASNRAVIDYACRWLTPNEWAIRTLPYADPNGVEKINLVAAPRRLLQHGLPDEAFASPVGSAVERRSQEDDVPSVELALVCHTDTVPYPGNWPEAVHPKVMNGRVTAGARVT
jgi:acetylornithine deacetylase